MPQSLDAESQSVIVKSMVVILSILASTNLVAQKIVLPRLRAKQGQLKWMGPPLFLACLCSFLYMAALSALLSFPIFYFGVGKVDKAEVGVTDHGAPELTASINFCEDDFTDSTWIAEPVNAASSIISYSPLALLFLVFTNVFPVLPQWPQCETATGVAIEVS